jgi:hypothetical protein
MTMNREDNSVHKGPITFLGWSPEGSRLVTGDQVRNLLPLHCQLHHTDLTLV